MGELKTVDTKELGEVIDMIKDLSETLYYCEIYKQMEEAEEHPKERNYYRDMDRGDQQRMYYHDDYAETDYPITFHDTWEGRSPIKRKMYMESKATHQANNKITKDLENYMTDLTSDMLEILDKATPEEKMIMQRKVDALLAQI